MKAVFSILKSFLALCGLAALSTALSADSRLSSVGAGSAGAAGFLYSDYLQTAAASGRSPELQGSFVVENHRPFLTDIGGQLPGRIVDEIKTLPLREWGLGYVFEDRRPAHQTALAERGWRVADWLAEETLMAATESSRGGGFIRTLEFDLQSELGGRRGSAGLNVLGALRETADYDALAWQLRGFKTKDGGGGSAGLIYRWLPDETALVGVNAFADYETNNGNGFWRWSAGAEVRTAWADLFGNYYQGITDDKRRGDEWIYTADGYDVELNVHSPDLPWLVGEITYFNWKGRHGDDDDRGFRFGVKVKPATGVEVALEYEKRNSDSDTDDGDNKKEWSGWVRYSGKLGEPARRLRSGGEYNNYEPRDYFFSPAEREYSQRIRKAPGPGNAQLANTPRFKFAVANLDDSLPIDLKEGTDLNVRIDETRPNSGSVVLMGTVNGQTIPMTPLNPVAGFYTFTISAAFTGTVTVSHMGNGKLTLEFPQTQSTVVIGSTLAVATQPDDFFRLINGEAEVMVGGGGGSVFIVEQYADDENIRRIMIPVVSSPTPIATLAVTVVDPGNNAVVPATHLPPVVDLQDVLDMNLTVETVINGTMSVVAVNSFQASVELAKDPVLTDTSPPSYYKGAGAASSIIILGTLRTSGGGGIPYTSSKVSGSGDLVINNGVVGIPTSQAPATGDGNTLVLQIRVNDNPNDAAGIGGQTAEQMVGFTVVYRQIVPLSATLPGPSILPVYGVLGDSARKVVATARITGGEDAAITYSPINGTLRLETGHVVVIPAGNPPAVGDASAQTGGNLLTLNSEVRQAAYAGVPAMTVTLGLTVRYIAVPGVVLDLNRDGNPISDVVRIYGVENVARTEKIADIAASGGSGSVTPELRTSGADATTPNTFAISNNDLNLSRTFPAFGSPARATAVVVANDTGANAAVTPPDEKRVTVRLLPVRDKLMPGGNVDKAARNPNNVVSPTSPNATEGEFTVYVLEGQKEAGVIARVSPASAADNAAVEGLSGLQVNAPTRHSSSDTGLQIEQSGNDTNVMIAGTTTPTPSGVDLKLVLEYNDSGHPVSELTDSLLKTVSVHYETVEPFAPEVRNAAGNAVLTDPVTVYAAPTDNTEKLAAKLVKVGGAAGDMRVISYSPRNNLEVKDNGDVFVRANTTKGLSPFVVNVVLNDAETPEGSVTPQVEVRVTVVYEETRDVQASFADITGNNHFLGAADSSSGVRTLYFKDSANRSPQLDILRINAQSGTSQYTFNTNSPFGLDGFALTGSGNNRVLALLAAKADGAMAMATVEIDDSGDGSDISDPITLTASVAVKHVEAIAAKFVNTANDSDLPTLQVMSADDAVNNQVHIANVSAEKGTESFQYTKENGSSAELLLDANSGQVSLAGNYDPDGQNTLTIIVKVEDRGDGSTLTDDVLITLRFVLAETVRATAFLRGEFLPTGSGNDLAVSEARTIRVKTTEYNNGGQVAFGIRPSGGFGEPFAVSEEGATGLSADDTNATATGGAAAYPLRVVVDAGLNADNAPANLAATLVINDNETGSLTEGATITVSVVYNKVDPITAEFQQTNGTRIPGLHVVATANTHSQNLAVAKIGASGGVGSYTYRIVGNANKLLVGNDGAILVEANVAPALTDNTLVATVAINDSGDWAHVSDRRLITVSVLYSSEVNVELVGFADIRANANPAQIKHDGGTVYFEQTGSHANVEFGELSFSSAVPGVTGFIVTPGTANGLAYNTANNRVSIVAKCGNDNQADKSIRLVVNDTPDPNNVSEPLTLDIMVHSGAAECIEPINAQARTIGNPNGQAITEDLTAYALADVASTEVSVVATVFIEKGAGEYTSTKESGGELALVGDGKGLLTVQIPANTTPATGNGKELDIDIRINDEADKGGFLTPEAKVEITVNYIAVQPHGQFTAEKAAGVEGDVASGMLTVRRVAQGFCGV